MTTSASTGNVRFEGMGVGTEIWGATQANFLVLVPPQHAKEAAVLLNDPAAKQLASAQWAPDQSRNRLAQYPSPDRPNGVFVIRVYPVQPDRAMTTRPDEHKQPSPTDTRPAYAVPNAVTADPPANLAW